jgi:hypothetical protein
MSDPASEIRRRRARDLRNPERRVRRTERDHWILEGLSKMRFLTTTQISRLAFEGSRWAANKRLRKLLDAGLLRVWVRDLAKDNIYSLDRAGARHLMLEAQSSDAVTVPRGLDGNLDHLLSINQVRISMAVDLPEVGGELVWWKSDWEWPRGRKGIIPDALFTIRWEGGVDQVFALEVDNNSCSLRGFLKKMLGYNSLRHESRSMVMPADFLILVVGQNPRWLERYRLALSHAGLESRVWFAVLADVEEKGAAGSLWRPVHEERSYSLRDLVFLPCPNDGNGSTSAVLTGG